MADLQTVHRSTNGDDWLVERDGAGSVTRVVHQANAASGGARTSMPVDEFLERHKGSPEAGAVEAAMAR